MTIVSNISLFSAAGLTGTAQGTANAAAPQGLFDFLSMLFSTVPGMDAQAGTPDLQAKLAALLQNPPAGQEENVKSLLQMLQQGGKAPGAQDIAAKLAALLKSDSTAIQPTLTSDLTAASAPIIQNVQPQETAASALADAPAGDDLAALLDKLAPGASEDTPAIDRTIMHRLLRAAATEEKAGGTFDKDKAAAFLKEQGLDEKTIAHYISVFDKVIAHVQAHIEAKAESTDTAVLHAVQAEAGNAVAPKTAKQPPGPTQFAEAKKPDGTSEDPNTRPAPRAEAAEPQKIQQQKAAEAPQKAAIKQEAAAHPSLINSLVSADASAGTQTDTSAAALMSRPANAPSFTNYMSAARTDAAPMTQMVNVQLQANATNKVEMMTLQLEPAHLGRLDIRMKFEKDGSIKAHLSADKPETLAMLQRDASHLHRALSQAGFDMDDASLSFDLRQQGQGQQDAGNAQDQRQNNGNAYGRGNYGQQNDTLQAAIAVQAYGYISQAGVNIMV